MVDNDGVRVWPALLLLSCSRPNPLFLDGAASDDMSSGTGTSTTAADPTGESSTSSPTPTTSAEATTDESTSSGTTGVQLPVCGPFSDERLVVDPPLPAAQCAAVTEFFGKVTRQGDTADIALCSNASCGSCSFSVPLDPGLVPYVVDGSCLRVVHQGMWVTDDLEAPSGCKTTALAIYDDASVYPLYAASSRVIEAPGFLDSDVRMDVARGEVLECACDDADCCLEGQAMRVRLEFKDHGEAVGILGAAEFVTTDLKGAAYIVAVVRAHVKGRRSAATQECVADPATQFIDWHMLRVQAP